MLSQSLLWRKKHGVDKILSEYQVSLKLCLYNLRSLFVLPENKYQMEFLVNFD